MKPTLYVVFCLSFITLVLSAQDTSYMYKKTETRDLSLHVYYPDNWEQEEHFPAIVFYFGGGWVSGDPSHFHHQCEYLAARGMVAIAADYRTKSKDSTSPIESMMDAKSAMRWIRQNAATLRIDTSKIAAAGGSAGGHLALVTALIGEFNDPKDKISVSSMPNALILFNPVVDISYRGYGANKLGSDSLKASPIHHISENLPPTIIFHGTADDIVPFENVQRFDSIMKINENKCELVGFHGKKHGFFNHGRNNNKEYNETLFLTDKFLNNQNFLNGAPTNYVENPNASVFVQPLMAGEPTTNSIILQARLVRYPFQINNDIIGTAGTGYFEIADNREFDNSLKSNTLQANQHNDFILKALVKGLKPATRYYYRIHYGTDKNSITTSNSANFNTLQGADIHDSISFVMVTGSHYQRFFWNWGTQKTELGKKPADYVLSLGFPGHTSVRDLQPDFYIGNGDNVYYDHVETPHGGRPDSIHELRACWHRQFSLPRFQQLLSEVPVFWMKDDHDYRFDDADTTTSERFGDLPSHKLGVNTFLEQVPVANPTYRTYRVNKHLQIWMLEGRDYRSPNNLPDSEAKSIWGEKQEEWLKKTLLDSDATYKLVVTPTPMIGPDDNWKTDNHTNIGGFRTERDEFFNWIVENDFLNQGFYLLCGDRHWQYHSIDPTGIEEFSCGALVDNNSRLGRKPGDPKSTDPEGLIQQPYTQKVASGGFMHVSVFEEKQIPNMKITFYDEHGQILHQVTKHR